jgi:pSer/pThr/pTyr-binding forkhead associated (FHA) protein
VSPIFCNRCGHRNPEGSNFCSSCGAVLERPTADPATSTIKLAPVEASGEVGEEEVVVTMGDLPAGTGFLVVKRGPNAGSRFALAESVTTIGRHPDSDIFLDDVTVSRRHAEVRQEEAIFTVVDVGSLNGTYLNRERIDQAKLRSGDELQVGKFRLVFLHEHGVAGDAGAEAGGG